MDDLKLLFFIWSFGSRVLLSRDPFARLCADNPGFYCQCFHIVLLYIDTVMQAWAVATDVDVR